VAAGRGEPAAPVRAGADADPSGGLAAGSRGELEARQRELVAALVAGAEPPGGLDRERVRVQAAALLRKRGRGVAHAQPELAAALGKGFWDAFGSYARGRTGPPPDCAADDALAFARWLRGAALGQPHASAEVRREAGRVTRPRRLRQGLRLLASGR
jgi:hypothetical protein